MPPFQVAPPAGTSCSTGSEAIGGKAMARDRWGRVAASYEEGQTYVVGPDVVERVQRAVTGAVPPGDVVEFGCGTGLYTRVVARRCANVIAIDRSAPMVAAALEALAGVPNVVVRTADATATGLPGGSADAVVAVNLLHIVPDPGAVLAEARRVLRPGGLLIVADATDDGMSLGRRVAAIGRLLRRPRLLPALGLSRDRHNLTQASLEAVVRAAGFTSVEGRLLRGRLMNAAFVGAARPS